MRATQSPVQPGDIVAGKYRVERLLGVGGMGVVVAATHLDLLEPRALKFMISTALSDVEAAERFMREARSASRLKSEHVARVHDVGRLADGTPYIVMEYLDGGDLSDRLRQDGVLGAEDAILYVFHALDALAEAHAAGIVHRDLKPANLFLTVRPDGSPCLKVLDFGVSKVLDDNDSDVTKTDAVLGSPSYMSPEQMRSSRNVDARSDIWSLGVILYQLLTRQLPYAGRSVAEVVGAMLLTTPAPPSQLIPSLSPALDGVVLRCLYHDPAARYANVGELAQALLPFAPPPARFMVERIQRLAAASRRFGPGSSKAADASLPYGSATPASGLVAAPLPLTASLQRQACTPAPEAPWRAMPSGAKTLPAIGPIGELAHAPVPTLSATGSWEKGFRGVKAGPTWRSHVTLLAGVVVAVVSAIVVWSLQQHHETPGAAGQAVAAQIAAMKARQELPPSTSGRAPEATDAPRLPASGRAPEATKTPALPVSATSANARPAFPAARSAPSQPAPRKPVVVVDPFGMDRK